MPAYATFPASSGTAAGFNPLPAGGGGFVTGVDFSADGLRVGITTDVGGAYLKDIGVDAKWRPVLTTLTLEASEYGSSKPNNYQTNLADGEGAYCLAISPANKNHILVGYNGFVYRTTNGVNLSRCNLPAKRMLANTKEQRMWQKKFVYHPTDTNTFLICTNNDGQYFTTNGGSAFTTITSVPAGNTVDSNPAAHVGAIDPGDPNYVYISRGGTGIYRSTTGLTAAGFAHVTGGPTSARYMQVIASGVLFVVTVEGTFWKLARGSNTWTQITGWGGWGAYTFAVNPADASSIVLMGADGEMARSTDGGSTWVGGGRWFDTIPAPIGVYQNSTDTYWLDGYVGSFYPAEIKFRPGVSNELWAAQGLGISKSNPPTTYVRWDWYGEHGGIEELGFTKSLSIPGNTRPLFLSLDKAIYRPKNLDASNTYPIFPGTAPSAKGNVEHGWDIDYAPEDPNYLACLANYNNPISGFSTDGGKTWQKFAAQHPDGALGGCLAVTGVGKIIWVPSNNAKAVYTADGGQSWQYINMGGSSGGISRWGSSIFVRRYIVTSDKTRPGHAAIVVNDSLAAGETQGIPGGVYKTTDHGANWTNKFTGKLDPTGDALQFWHNIFKYVPGKGSELLFASGITFPTSGLTKSADDGASWTPVRSSEITGVNFFDFGKAKTGQTYPVVFLDATVNGVDGIYRSEDWFATTPQLLGRFPMNEIVSRSFIGGDMNRYGRLFAGLSGKGLVYGNFP